MMTVERDNLQCETVFRVRDIDRARGPQPGYYVCSGPFPHYLSEIVSDDYPSAEAAQAAADGLMAGFGNEHSRYYFWVFIAGSGPCPERRRER